MIVEEYCKGMDCYSSRAEYDYSRYRRVWLIGGQL